MNSTATFLEQELFQLGDCIQHLEQSLKHYAPDDPRSAGNRTLLNLKSQQRRLVQGLLALAGTPDLLQTYTHGLLRDIQHRHQHLTQSGAAHDLSQADSWWDSLGEVQYLSDLLDRLNDYVHHEHPEAAQAEPPTYLENGRMN